VLSESLRPAPQPQTNHVDLLKSNLTAFAERLKSVTQAQRTLDLMYYIWHEDTSGLILIHELWKAADRGVKVRLILDAINFKGPHSLFVGLSQHPNVEICLYNAFRFGFINLLIKFFEVLLRATALNRRMHNKCWLVDGETAICGGRNIGDEYFGNKKSANFTDLDISLTGPTAKKFGECFDLYWNSRHVRSIENIRGLEPRFLTEDFRHQLGELRKDADATDFGRLLIEQKIPPEEKNNFAINDDQILVVYDPPEKLGKKKCAHPTTAEEVFGLLTSAKESVCVVSPYFVPGPRGSKALKIAAEKACHVRILTNSLAATDAIAAHSGVMKYRKSLLDRGIELYELKPTGKIQKRLGILPKSRASLHAKAIVVDQKRSYVGSFNLDPRSAILNCEMGMVANHAPLAQEILRIYNDTTDPVNSWRLTFTENRRLTWIGKAETGEDELFYSEPQAGRFKRFAAWFFGRLPIEPLL
jgi:putative cardiolipin synthase